MPVYKTLRPNSKTLLKIWHITESYEHLMGPLNLKPSSLERVLGMKSETHQKGFLSVRHLLRSVGYTDQDLFYDDFGKPHLKDGKYISISHSYQYSGIIISEQPVGIDIEKQREKISIIAKKFVQYEFNYLNSHSQDYIRMLTVIWGIKEALYKLFATAGMLFKEHFLVIPFSLIDCETVAWIDYKEKKERFNAWFFEFDGFTCAYTLKS